MTSPFMTMLRAPPSRSCRDIAAAVPDAAAARYFSIVETAAACGDVRIMIRYEPGSRLVDSVLTAVVRGLAATAREGQFQAATDHRPAHRTHVDADDGLAAVVSDRSGNGGKPPHRHDGIVDACSISKRECSRRATRTTSARGARCVAVSRRGQRVGSGGNIAKDKPAVSVGHGCGPSGDRSWRRRDSRRPAVRYSVADRLAAR